MPSPVSIVWTPRARKHLKRMVEFSAGSADIARRIMAMVSRLPEFPLLGRMVPEYTDDSLREVIVDAYRVVYRWRERRVRLIGIVRAGRDIVRELSSEP